MKNIFIMILSDNVFAVIIFSETPQFWYKMTRLLHKTNFRVKSIIILFALILQQFRGQRETINWCRKF